MGVNEYAVVSAYGQLLACFLTLFQKHSLSLRRGVINDLFRTGPTYTPYFLYHGQSRAFAITCVHSKNKVALIKAGRAFVEGR